MEQEKSLRERIIAYAGPMFFEQGFSRITTEELSRQLGISKKTLYREFDSKEEIVRAVVRARLARAGEELSHIFDDESQNILERLGAQMNVATRVMQSLSKPFLADLSRYAPELWEEIQEFRRRRVFDRLEGMFRDGQEEGLINPQVNPRLLRMIIITIADNLLVPKTLAENDLSPQEAIRHVGMLIGGHILTETGRRKVIETGIVDAKGEKEHE
jgi:AcrR family transcriptional regulator